MKIAALILAILASPIVLFFGGSALNDFWCRRETRYAPGFSEAAIRAIRPGDERAQILATLGEPVNRYLTVQYPNGSYNLHEVAFLSELPSGTSLYREALNYSYPTTPLHDYRRVAVVLDREGRVIGIDDYVTD